MLRVQASAASSADVKPEVGSAVQTLKKAAANSTVPPSAVCNALTTLEKAKLQVCVACKCSAHALRLIFDACMRQMSQRLASPSWLVGGPITHVASRHGLQAGQEWSSIIGGTASPGNRWRLVFTTGAKLNKVAGGGKGSGAYFPLTGERRRRRPPGLLAAAT